MEERLESYSLTGEETTGFFLCPLFTLQSVATGGWVGLLSALVPLASWGDVFQPPWESRDLTNFSDLDVWNHQDFAEVIQTPCQLMAF